MHLRMCIGMIAVVVAAAACKKSSPEAGSGAGTSSGSAPAGTAGGSGAIAPSAEGSAAPAGSAVVDSGSAGGSGVASSAVPAGSNAAAPGPGAGSGSAPAAPAGSGAAPAGYDKAAFLQDPLCVQVADKIRTCVENSEFIAALDDGATAQQKKINARLRRGVKKWQTSHELCRNAWDIINYEYTGFLDNPGVFKAPNALSSCADLGTAVKAGGGLVGGTTAE